MQPKRSIPITGRKVRFGIVGCGRISKNHIEALQKHSDRAEIAAVCDVGPKALQTAKEKTGAPGFENLESLLTQFNVDIVSLCTPSGIHPEQAILASRFGVHVVSEKPMATKWQDGKKMTEACAENGVRLFVVKQNRFNPTIQKLKGAISSGRFGKIYMATFNVLWTRPQEYYAMAPWRGTRDLDGGAFMNQASHYVDLMTWLLGPIDQLSAFTGTLARQIETEDSGIVAVRWKSGALGSINMTMLTYPKNLEGSITIIGETGTARIGGIALNQVLHWEFKDKLPEDEKIFEASYETASVYGSGHPIYYDNVIKVLRGEAEPEVDGHEGLKSLQTLIAIARSAEEARPVTLPLE